MECLLLEDKPSLGAAGEYHVSSNTGSKETLRSTLNRWDSSDMALESRLLVRVCLDNLSSIFRVTLHIYLVIVSSARQEIPKTEVGS